MTYTVIYEDKSGIMNTFTFISGRHDRSSAWHEFANKYAEEGQKPIAIMPGQHVVYFKEEVHSPELWT
jgi:hypothetical protein